MSDAPAPCFRVETVTPPKALQPIQVVIVDAAHLVDGPALDALRTAIEDLQAGQPRLDLLVDLTRVEMLSSPAIGLLGMEHRKIWNAKGRMKLCGITASVMQVFKITRLDGYFDIYETQAAAIASF